MNAPEVENIVIDGDPVWNCKGKVSVVNAFKAESVIIRNDLVWN